VRERYEGLVRERFGDGEESRGIGVKDHHEFMFELWNIANERADAFEIAYAEERSLRETVEDRVERLLDFLREAGIFHPRGHEENEKNERLARQEEERKKNLQEEELRRMLRSEKRPPKEPPPIAPQEASPKAEQQQSSSSQGRMKEPPQGIGNPPVKEEMIRLKALAEYIVKEPPGAGGIPPTRLAKSDPADTPWKIPPPVKGSEVKAKPPPPKIFSQQEGKAKQPPPPMDAPPKRKSPPPPLDEPPEEMKKGYPTPPKALAPPNIPIVPAIPQRLHRYHQSYQQW
jgi:hypothetical protein